MAGKGGAAPATRAMRRGLAAVLVLALWSGVGRAADETRSTLTLDDGTPGISVDGSLTVTDNTIIQLTTEADPDIERISIEATKDISLKFNTDSNGAFPSGSNFIDMSNVDGMGSGGDLYIGAGRDLLVDITGSAKTEFNGLDAQGGGEYYMGKLTFSAGNDLTFKSNQGFSYTSYANQVDPITGKTLVFDAGGTLRFEFGDYSDFTLGEAGVIDIKAGKDIVFAAGTDANPFDGGFYFNIDTGGSAYSGKDTSASMTIQAGGDIHFLSDSVGLNSGAYQAMMTASDTDGAISVTAAGDIVNQGSFALSSWGDGGAITVKAGGVLRNVRTGGDTQYGDLSLENWGDYDVTVEAADLYVQGGSGATSGTNNTGGLTIKATGFNDGASLVSVHNGSMAESGEVRRAADLAGAGFEATGSLVQIDNYGLKMFAANSGGGAKLSTDNLLVYGDYWIHNPKAVVELRDDKSWIGFGSGKDTPTAVATIARGSSALAGSFTFDNVAFLGGVLQTATSAYSGTQGNITQGSGFGDALVTANKVIVMLEDTELAKKVSGVDSTLHIMDVASNSSTTGFVAPRLVVAGEKTLTVSSDLVMDAGGSIDIHEGGVVAFANTVSTTSRVNLGDVNYVLSDGGVLREAAKGNAQNIFTLDTSGTVTDISQILNGNLDIDIGGSPFFKDLTVGYTGAGGYGITGVTQTATISSIAPGGMGEMLAIMEGDSAFDPIVDSLYGSSDKDAFQRAASELCLGRTLNAISMINRELHGSMLSRAGGMNLAMATQSNVSSPDALASPSFGACAPNGVWIAPLYRFNRRSNDYGKGVVGYDVNSWGFMGGYDRSFGDAFTAGAYFGYTDGRLKDNASGRIDADDFQTGLYGTFRLPENFEVNAGLGFGWQNYDSVRRFPTERLDADFDGYNLDATLEVAKSFLFSNCSYLRPSAGYGYQYTHIDGIKERSTNPGLGSMAQNSRSNSLSQHHTRLGVAGGWNSGRLDIGAKAYWVYRFGDDIPETRANFRYNAAAGTFGVRGAQIDRNAANIGLDVKYHVNRSIMVGAGYDAMLGSKSQAHQASLFLRCEF